MPDRTIFRESAVEAYRRRTERDVVPRLVSRPIIVCCWVLLGTFVAAALAAWSVHVPTYVDASGVIDGSSRGTAAVLFLPTAQSARLRAGRPVHVRVGSSGASLRGEITNVERGLIGPAAARRRYRIAGAPDLVTEPSIVATARLGTRLRSDAYGGSRITARVEVGSQRLLGLLLRFGSP
jgi:hypothetical protein